MKKQFILFFAFVVVFTGVPVGQSKASNLTPDDLKKAISDKSKSLEDINNQLKIVSQAFKETQNRGKSLSQEIKKIDNNIKQLDLYIKSSEINIQKINLEIESLQYKIQDTEQQMSVKKNAVSDILRQMHEFDQEDILVTILKNRSLAESVVEIQNLSDLSGNLSANLKELDKLHEDLSQYMDETNSKKSDLELENRNMNNRKLAVEGEKSDRKRILDQTKNQEKAYQVLMSDLERQQNAISDEISKIEDELRSKFDTSLLPSKRPGVFMWPIKVQEVGGDGIITQHFGEISSLYRGKPHNGLDIGTPIGTPVFAADDGKVISADNNDQSRFRKYQYGHYVLIEHQNNLDTLYAHLENAVVSGGDMVKRGQLIGYSGNSGYATGPHLHFGVYWAPSVILKTIPPAAGLVPVGVVINPEDYL